MRMLLKASLEDHYFFFAAIGADGSEAAFALMLRSAESELPIAEQTLFLDFPGETGFILLEVVGDHSMVPFYV
jgi:hypothetical protein